MATFSVIRTIFIVLSFFSLQALGARNHPRRIPHAERPVPYEPIVPGAGCTVPLPSDVRAPKKNVWAPLDRAESHEVQKWLMKQKELNLTNNDNYIYDFALMTPNKTDVCPPISVS